MCANGIIIIKTHSKLVHTMFCIETSFITNDGSQDAVMVLVDCKGAGGLLVCLGDMSDS